MSNFSTTRSKLAVVDQGAISDVDSLGQMFRFKIEKILITRNGKTVASLVKGYDIAQPDQPQAGKVVIVPFQFFVPARSQLFAGLIRMATEGEVTLALETEYDGSEHLLLAASTEKFDPNCEHVVVLYGEDQMRIGYQLYCSDVTVGKNVLGKNILNYDDYVRTEIERMCG
jgi:hypothetical protein